MLTPGDFTTIVRKNRIFGEELGPENILNELTKEVQFKRASSNCKIGFLAT